MSLRDWFDKTPEVEFPSPDEIRRRWSHVATTTPRPLKGKDPAPKYYEPFSAPNVGTSDDHKQITTRTVIPSDWNKKVPDKLNPADGRDIMAEIEWEYSPEGAQELKHLFALWHLNDEVWQRQRKKAINLAVYGEEDPFNEEPYYHVISFSDSFGIKHTSYPKHEEKKARHLYDSYRTAWIDTKDVIFVEGKVEIGGKVE